MRGNTTSVLKSMGVHRKLCLPLIYKGHVLKDDKTLESYGVGEDHVIHLVKGPAPGAQASTPPATTAPGASRSLARSTFFTPPFSRDTSLGFFHPFIAKPTV